MKWDAIINERNSEPTMFMNWNQNKHSPLTAAIVCLSDERICSSLPFTCLNDTVQQSFGSYSAQISVNAEIKIFRRHELSKS